MNKDRSNHPDHPTATFIGKLHGKMIYGPSFVDRVKRYQALTQPLIVRSSTIRLLDKTKVQLSDIAIHDGEFVEILISKGSLFTQGHAIGLIIHRNDSGQAVGFRIYDPNEGEYIFEKASQGENKRACFGLLNDIIGRTCNIFTNSGKCHIALANAKNILKDLYIVSSKVDKQGADKSLTKYNYYDNESLNVLSRLAPDVLLSAVGGYAVAEVLSRLKVRSSVVIMTQLATSACIMTWRLPMLRFGCEIIARDAFENVKDFLSQSSRGGLRQLE